MKTIGSLLIGLLLASTLAEPVEAQSGTDELRRQLSTLQSQLHSISEQMATSGLTGDLLERQRDVTDRLRRLIQQTSSGEQSRDEPESASGSQRSGAGRSPGEGQATSDPLDENTQEAAPPRDANPKQAVLDAWGSMAEELRERLGESIQPRFLPRYGRLIRDYYLRMSEQR